MKQTIERIEQLKKEKDVLVLAHFYVPDEVLAIADHLGDSYALSKIAADAEQSTILFCGVRFMGESAKILSPDKTVLLPDAEADCLMAHMITPEQVLEMKKQYPLSAISTRPPRPRRFVMSSSPPPTQRRSLSLCPTRRSALFRTAISAVSSQRVCRIRYSISMTAAARSMRVSVRRIFWTQRLHIRRHWSAFIRNVPRTALP